MEIATLYDMDLEQVLREEVDRLGACLDVLVPFLRRPPRHGWLNHLVSFLRFVGI